MLPCRAIQLRSSAVLGTTWRTCSSRARRSVCSAVKRRCVHFFFRRLCRTILWHFLSTCILSIVFDEEIPMRSLRPPLNRYFVRVCTDTARQVDSSGPELPVRLPRVATGRFQVAPISPDDLCRVVGRMRNSAACGSDGLCIRFIKICLPSLVFSIIRYCMSVYGICNQTQLHRVQKLVNFAARVLNGRRRHQHISDIITSAGCLTAQELFHYHRIIAVHTHLAAAARATA